MGDYVYDQGRVTRAGRFSLLLWAPREFRPVVIAGEPAGGTLGTLTLDPGEGARAVRIVARDVAGHRTERELVMRPPGSGERGPAPGG